MTQKFYNKLLWYLKGWKTIARDNCDRELCLKTWTPTDNKEYIYISWFKITNLSFKKYAHTRRCG
jgi:hypothetical protein